MHEIEDTLPSTYVLHRAASGELYTVSHADGPYPSFRQSWVLLPSGSPIKPIPRGRFLVDLLQAEWRPSADWSRGDGASLGDDDYIGARERRAYARRRVEARELTTMHDDA